MRYLGLLASAFLLMGGQTGARAQAYGGYPGEWKVDVGGITSASGRDDFHAGIGAGGAVAYEKLLGRADSRFGLRGSYLDYQREGTPAFIPDNFQEYSVALESLVGPSLASFDPKVGGHVGYVRQDGAGPIQDENLLDVGFDLMGAIEFTRTIGMQAVLTPLWLINDDDADYQTRAALNLEIIIHGA